MPIISYTIIHSCTIVALCIQARQLQKLKVIFSGVELKGCILTKNNKKSQKHWQGAWGYLICIHSSVLRLYPHLSSTWDSLLISMGHCSCTRVFLCCSGGQMSPITMAMCTVDESEVKCAGFLIEFYLNQIIYTEQAKDKLLMVDL